MRKAAPWPVDWIDPAEAIARRALSLLPPGEAAEPSHGDDIAIFTSGNPNPATRRLMHGFGLTVED
jgi:glutamate racemase